MLDAEIAVTLLNRWWREVPGRAALTSLELLREGGLTFVHQRGHMLTEGPDGDACGVESLLFPDGSRAMRIGTQNPPPNWTKWAAFDPVHELSSTLSNSS
ncbi:hypothetical protein WN982_07865 [Paraburkholderia sp. IMGN_8]|uniref:hypothetical protein n=1 Tax=Paraburkholderia sp. IMGN_8 TaxID=3136564 RepID=UPI003101AB0A